MIIFDVFFNKLQNAIEEAEKERIRRVENEKLRQAENLQQINYDLEKLIEKRDALWEQKKCLLRELEMLNEDKVNNNDCERMDYSDRTVG
jgi:hypothetical protein